MRLTDDMKRVVLEQRLGFVATVNADGTPNLSPKGTTTVWDDERLCFAHIRSPRTIGNLRRNPAIEINVVDPFARRGYRFAGTGAVHEGDETYRRGLELLRSRDYGAYEERVEAIVVIDVKRAEPVTSPVYDLPNVSEEEVRRSYEERYEELRATLRAPEPPLSDGVVTLRPPLPSDVPAVTRACQDPEIHRWLAFLPSPYTEDSGRYYVADAEAMWRRGRRASFVIVDADGVFLGTAALTFHDDGVASVGYWLAAEARGRGAATRATSLIARWAFDAIGVERLELTTEPGNEASQRVAERAGFTREGVLRGHLKTPDGRRDSVVFARLPDDVR